MDVEIRTREPRPRRGWRWQFSLRSLFVVIAIAALLLGWLSDRAARQSAAVKRFTQLNAKLYFEGEFFDSAFFYMDSLANYDSTIGEHWTRSKLKDQNGEDVRDANGIPLVRLHPELADSAPAPAWRRQFTESDYLRKLAAVDARDTAMTQEDLRLLCRVTWLKRLALDGAQWLNDDDLAPVVSLTALERLYLRETRVGDAVIEHLSGLTNLRYLSLAGTALTDEGLRHVSRLRNLELLDICDTRVSDAGIRRLTGLALEQANSARPTA
jgi:hypothetical protein